MRRVVLSSLGDSFFGAAFSVLVPLLMYERGVGIASIGIVFALSPIVFQTIRMLLSLSAEVRGTKRLFLLNAFLYPISGLAYFLSHSIPAFLFGKFVEGVRTASIIAVQRSAALQLSSRDPKVTSSLFALSSIASAGGVFAVAVLLSFFSLSHAILIFSFLSLLLLIPALRMPDLSRDIVPHHVARSALNIRKKPSAFIRVMLAICFNAVEDALVFAFVLTLFLSVSGLSLWNVALLIGLFALVSGLTSIFLIHLGLKGSNRQLLVFQLVVGSSALAFFPFASPAYLLPAIIVLGIADGFTRLSFESLVVHAVRSSRTLSVDISLLHLPFHLIRAATLVAAGFLVTALGFPAVFTIAAGFYAMYSLASMRVLLGN